MRRERGREEGRGRLVLTMITVCVDVDECKNGSSNCDLKTSYCVNAPGSYSCGPCPAGQEGTIFNVCTGMPLHHHFLILFLTF